MRINVVVSSPTWGVGAAVGCPVRSRRSARVRWRIRDAVCVPLRLPLQPYTEYISTRWYRAPECLLTDGYYGYKMDMWGVGCVMFEVLALFPLFPGSDEADQIARIHKIMGTPSAAVSALGRRAILCGWAWYRRHRVWLPLP